MSKIIEEGVAVAYNLGCVVWFEGGGGRRGCTVLYSTSLRWPCWADLICYTGRSLHMTAIC